MRKSLTTLASITAMGALLVGCAAPMQPSVMPTASPNAVGSYPPAYSGPVGVNPAYMEYGRVSNIELIQSASGAGPNPNSGTAGAVLGGIVGGVLGNQVGSGSGRAAATALGVVGGALAGSQIARRSDGSYSSPTGMVYRITVQTEGGAWRAYDVGTPGDLRVGDRVRIENNTLFRS